VDTEYATVDRQADLRGSGRNVARAQLGRTCHKCAYADDLTTDRGNQPHFSPLRPPTDALGAVEALVVTCFEPSEPRSALGFALTIVGRP